jgi:hypothetical protein
VAGDHPRGVRPRALLLAIVILKQDTCRLTREPWACALVAGAEILVRAAAEKSSIKIVVNHLNTEKWAKFTAKVEVFRGEFLHGVDDIPPGEPSAL